MCMWFDNVYDCAGDPMAPSALVLLPRTPAPWRTPMEVRYYPPLSLTGSALNTSLVEAIQQLGLQAGDEDLDAWTKALAAS